MMNGLSNLIILSKILAYDKRLKDFALFNLLFLSILSILGFLSSCHYSYIFLWIKKIIRKSRKRDKLKQTKVWVTYHGNGYFSILERVSNLLFRFFCSKIVKQRIEWHRAAGECPIRPGGEIFQKINKNFSESASRNFLIGFW